MQGEQRLPLGQVSSSRLNVQAASPHTAGKAHARMSLGPGTLAPRYSMGGGMASSKSKRMSMMPTMGAGGSSRRQSMMSTASGIRRKSMATAGGSSVLKADPRPIADKAYMRSCIENLIRFLVEHNYDQAISPKILHRPTGKDFENVVLFLFGLLDPHRRSSGKFADDVTVMYKGLRYPFNISKTALAAVGSPHTWPALLASLTWMVELLEYDEMAGLSVEDYSELPPDAVDSDKQFFTYLKRAYAYFLAGDDASQAKLDDERKSYILSDQAAVRKQMGEVERTRAALERQLEAEAATPSEIPELEQEKRDFQNDRLKWNKLIRQFETTKAQVAEKVREREAECREREGDLAQAKLAKEAIQRTLDEQELSPADAQRMTQEREGLNKALASAAKNREDTQEGIWDLEKTISKRSQAVEETVEQYNSTARALRLVQNASAGGRQGANIILKIDPATSSVVCVGSEGTVEAAAIKKALEELHELSQNKVHQIKTEGMELQVKTEENEEESATLKAEIKALEQRLEQLERRHDEGKAEMERDLAVRAAETEQVEEEIHHLQTEAAAIRDPEVFARERAAALAAELAELKQANAEELALVDEELSQALETCCSFHEEISGALKSLEKDLGHRAGSARELCATKLNELRALAESTVGPA